MGDQQLSQAALLLRRQLRELQKHPVEGFSAGLADDSNIFEWEICIIGPSDTFYEGGIFRASLTFPPDYPQLPPKLKFLGPMYHPNVYPDGTVCISILHPPGDDAMSDPNDMSPANVDAAKQWREDRAGFKKKVAQIVRRTQEGE